MKKQILKYTLVVTTLTISFLAWYSIDRLVSGYGSQWWILSLVLFSSYFVLICLDMLLIEKKLVLLFTLLFSVLLSWIYTLDVLYLALLAVVFAVIWYFFLKVRQDLKTLVIIDLNKIFYIRKFWLILALSLAISGQYFFQIKDLPENKIIPKFRMNNTTRSLIVSTLGQVNPAFYSVEKDDLTVDQFISENYSAAVKSQIGSGTSQEESSSVETVRKASREEFLAEGRARFSELTGRIVLGNEKISDVFPEIVNKRLENHFVKEEPTSPLMTAITLSLILFVSLLSLGTLLGYFLVVALRFVFWLLKKFRLVRFSKVPVEMEVID